ncbi:carbohydrate sulfotransferase 14-like [Watersipora subatra]|uniref:carbohydrate sulfotransferase 14-like n=1 Tax=Watersipora subatra TaxID=2589382 RepID=UPI00355C4A4F
MAVNSIKRFVVSVSVLLLTATIAFMLLELNTQKDNDKLIVSVKKPLLAKNFSNLRNTIDTATHLEHWLPDWYNVSDVDILLKNRVRMVRERCESYNGERNIWKTKPLLRMVRSKRLVYCCTAKAGSTFWRNILQRVTETDVRGAPTKTMFTTVRNPWHRLVSMYIQKIETVYGRTLKSHVRQFCSKKVKGKPSFKVFVKDCVIAEWQQQRYNIHWLPSTERCKVCKSSNDFIVAVENMEPEANYILKMAGLTDPSTFFNNTRNETIRKNEKKNLSSSYQSYYKGMDTEDIETLQRIYAFDIYVLQYPQTPFVDFDKS